MNFRSRVLLRCLLLISVFLAASGNAFCAEQPTEIVASTTAPQSAAETGSTKRPVTVADSIQMTRLGDAEYEHDAGGAFAGPVAKFSPDGKRFVVILRKGNLEANTNEYSLVLFQTAEVFQSPQPQVVVSMASSSNRPAISDVIWQDDNDTILFLGERPGEETQLYSVKCSSGALKKLTNHATSLTSFAASASGARIAFSAKLPATTFLMESVARHGMVVSSDGIIDLIRGSSGGGDRDFDTLSIQKLGSETETKAALSGMIGGGSASPMWLSPDGKYLLLQTLAAQVSPAWHEYEDKYLQENIRNPGSKGDVTNVYQYELVDMNTDTAQVLIDAPIAGLGSEMAWSADSKSVVMSDMHLPLNVDDASELTLRKAHTFLVEVKVPSRQFVKISHEDLELVSWDPKTGLVACNVGRMDSDVGKATPKTYFRKSGETWSQASAPGEPSQAQSLPKIVLDEGMNTPPHIVAVDSDTGRKSTLMDLNPQFQNLALAKVEEITWKEPHGTNVKAGLYWPIDYIAGKKYPVVIQTHAWTPDRFWMDGPYEGTAFAAQPLAGKGFFVLQVYEAPDWHVTETPKEVTLAMSDYENAIDLLDRRGLIDRNRVGIIGFSRTCWYLLYTLTHSKYSFAAAVIADGVDYGFFQYMMIPTPGITASFENVTGAPPFGKGLRLWLERSPAFLMEKIKTPLRIQTLYPGSLLGEWDWYTGLTRLGKPVELIYIPQGVHILEKPWERMTSQQGDVDWLCFWLKGEEDPDPAKAEQYVRWRELRKLQP